MLIVARQSSVCKRKQMFYSSDLLPISGLESKLLLSGMDSIVKHPMNPFTVPLTIPAPQVLANKILTPVRSKCTNPPPLPPPLPQWLGPF